MGAEAAGGYRASTRLPADASSARAARRFLRARLTSWGLAATVIETGLLLVSELATNAVRHGEGDITVTVVLLLAVVRVQVEDANDVPPQRTMPDLHDEGGRGVWLVETLADRHGTTLHAGKGKTVWFELNLNAELFSAPFTNTLAYDLSAWARPNLRR